MSDFLPQLISLLEEEGRAALATVVSRAGSAPGPLGSKMVIAADGAASGTVGGGCMEASVAQAGGQALEWERWVLDTYTLTSRDAATSGMICGGMVGILVEPLSQGDLPLLRGMQELEEQRGRGVLVSLLQQTEKEEPRGSAGGLVVAKALLQPGPEPAVLAGSLEPVVLEEALAHISGMRGAVALVQAAEPGYLLLLEALGPPARLVIFGAGHMALELAHLASRLQFYVTVIDDRSLFASADRFPDVDTLLVGDYVELFDQVPIDEDSYLVIVTPGHFWDEDVLEKALATSASYIGMIGSRTKIRKIYQSLEAKGISPERLTRVHAPIGLDIGAKSPEEIAVSIAAELIQERQRALKR